MASAVLAISNSQTVDEANRTRFDEIRALATDFARRDIKAKEVLYRALDRLFGFVLDFDSEADRKAFVVANGGKWGKVASDNPFQPFVKMAFEGDGISDASRSQYATVLRYAQFYRDKTMSLAEWLGQPGGLELRYKEATSAVTGKQRYVDPERLDKAKQAIRSARRSDAFHLDDVPINVDEPEGGYVVALLHVAPNGAAHVVEYTERDSAKIESIIAGLALPQARRGTRDARPMARLHRALDILSDIVPVGKADTDVIFVLRNGNTDGRKHTVLQAMSTAYSGPLGEIKIGENFDWLVDELDVVFTHSTARAFSKGFDIEGHWQAELADGQVTFGHTHIAVQPIAAPTALPDAPYNVSRSDFRQDAPMTLKLDAARGFLAARKGKSPVKGAYSGPLALFWNDGYLSYRAAPNWPVVHDLFDMHRDPALPAERLFSADALADLCAMSDGLGEDIRVWLVSTPEEKDCAIMVDDTIDGDAIRLVVPLAISVRGDLTQTNSPWTGA